MRLFLFYLLAGWSTGILLGVWQAPMILVTATSAALAAVVRLAGLKAPVMVGAAVVCGLGFVWGGSVGIPGDGACTEIDAGKGVVVDRVDVRDMDVRFVAELARDCRVLVTASRFVDVREGAQVVLSGGERQSLAEVAEYSAGYSEYLARRGIGGTWRWPDVDVAAMNTSGVRGWHEAVRQRVQKLFVEPDASVVLAMLFAERGTLPDDLVDHFRASGVSHVLAISGLHISLLTGLLVGLLSLVPIRPQVRTVIAIAILWLYVAFIGAPASALRAASFWTLVLAALRLQKLVSLPTILTLTAAALLSVNPLLAADVGFQLSVSAVGGIFLTLFLARPFLRRWRWRWLWSLVLVSVGASAATAPLVAYHFGNVSLISVLANVFVVPAVPFVLTLALLALAFSFVWQPAALLFAWLLHVLLRWLDTVTRVLANLPGVFVEEVTVPVWFIGAYYLALGVVCAMIVHRQRRSWREVWG